MTSFNGWLQVLLPVALIFATAKPIGDYMYRVYTGQRTILGRMFGPVERLFYRVIGVNPNANMRWTTYAFAFLAFNIVGFPVHVRDFAGAGASAAQPARVRWHGRAPRLQHGDELRY